MLDVQKSDRRAVTELHVQASRVIPESAVLRRVVKRVFHRTVGLSLFKIYIQFHRLLHALSVLPYSRTFGYKRGTPIGRYYVQKFLRANAHLVIGCCLEFGGDYYKPLFPEADDYKVIDLVGRPGVDYLCDIHNPVGVPTEHFHAIICTQVFEHLAYPERAASSLYRLLSPGGLLLLTAPFINQIHYSPTDYRRFTPDGLELILREAGFIVEVVDYGGNSLVGTGSLLGMVAEDFTQKELDAKDPYYPYNVLIRAKKPSLHADAI